MKTKRFLFLLFALVLILALLAGCDKAEIEEDPLARSYNTLVYTEQGGAKLVIASGGELEVQEGATLDLQESPTITLGADELFLIDAATTAQTQTAGALDVNAASVTADTAAMDVLMTANDGTVAATDIYGGRMTITNNDADADMFGLKIVASATTNATTASYEYGILYDCAENTASACSDGLLVTASGANTGLTDGVDASATNIVNAINVGSNLVLGGNSDFLTVGATDATLLLTRNNTGGAIFQCADDTGAADCTLDTTGAGAITIGSADVTNVTVNSDAGLTFANNSDSINNLVNNVFDFGANTASGVTLIASDDDATAGMTLDAGGAEAITIGSADVTNITVNSDVGLTFANNSDSLNNLTDAAFDFTRNTAGIVTLTSSDDDATAGMTLDAGGISPIVIGSADVSLITLLPDNDVAIQNGATGDVILGFHDYADSDNDDMAHAIQTVNCTTATTAAEDCDFSIGVVEGGAAAETRFALDADGGVDIGSANVDDVTFVAGGVTSIFSAAPAASAGGDFWDLTGAFGIANGTDTMIGFDMNLTGAAHTGTGNSTVGMSLNLTTPDAQVPSVAIDLEDADWDLAIDSGDIPIMSTAATWFDDFVGDTLNPTWVLLNGSDGQALDPALAQGQFGLVVLEGGDSNANVAADGSELALGLHWSADQGSLVMEARVHINDITTAVACVGLSDSIALEVPATIGGSDVVTAVADDGVFFCYDTRADTDEWFFIGIDATTVATGTAVSGVAPVNGAFQVLRIEVDAGGEDARGYINGTLVGSLTGNAVTITDLLSPFAIIQPVVAAVRDLTVDYLYVSAQRQ